MAAKTTMENYDPTNLPPGFRFHPTDDELVGHYLVKKASDPMRFMVHAITDIDLNKCEPWDLPHKAKMGEKEWYFFSQRDRKYPTGMRTNRATEKGYWKATGKDRDVVRNREGGHSGQMVVGMKKTLVFYKGRAPRGVKTHWIMHEYRLDKEGVNMVTQAVATLRLPGSGKDEWVVCRIFEKQSGNKKNLGMLDVHMGPYHTGYGDPSSPLHDHPDMDDDGETSLSPYGTNRVTNFNDLLSPASIPVGNPLSVLGEMNGRVFSSYSASSFPGVNASLSPPTGPLSSDLSSTLHSPNYADLSPHVSNILNVVTNSGPNYSIANANYAMTQLLSQPMMQQGVHMGGLRSCKVEYPFEPMVPCTSSGEDEAHSGQTTSPGPLMDISPNHHGWIANIGDDLQFQPGLQQQRGHITADQLNQASYLPAAESSCVTEENQNSLYRINGFRYMETSTSGRVPGWAC